MIYKILYIIGINILTFILMGWDKYCAKKDYWRISESNLLGLAILGGGIGAFLGMITFRHKTKKSLFKIGLPISIIINILFYIYILI